MAARNEIATYERREREGTLTLTGAVDIFEAALVHAAARSALDDLQAIAICVNIAGAHRFDLSAIQLLLALRRDVRASGRAFLIRGESSFLTKSTEPLGVCFEPTSGELNCAAENCK